MITATGLGLAPAIRGESNILEVMRRDGLMDDFYGRSLGMAEYVADVARVVGELAHRFPHMHIVV